MQEKAIVYAIVAYLACWLVDLIRIIMVGPLFIDPILKFIIVLLCLAVILYSLSHARWLL
jgi:hypothetical protein